MKISVQENVKKIDQILEPVSNMCDEHKRNEARRKKLLGDQSAFIEDRVRNLPAGDREKFINQHGSPENLLKPRYLSPEEAGKLTYADAGAKLIKPMSEGITANIKIAKAPMQGEKLLEKIQEKQAEVARMREGRR